MQLFKDELEEIYWFSVNIESLIHFNGFILIEI